MSEDLVMSDRVYTQKQVGAAAAVIGLVFLVWQFGDAVTSKIVSRSSFDQFAKEKTEVLRDHEARIRELERQWDRFFGSQSKTSSYDGQDGIAVLKVVSLPTTQSAPSQIDQRRVVVLNREFIELARLRPTRGGTYGVLGEDGSLYSLDEVLQILVQQETERMSKQKR